MNEQELGIRMLEFERNQVKMALRPPLPCDGKVTKQTERRWDRSEELLWIIKRQQGLTTNDLFLEVSFAHADFTAALRKLENAGKLLVGRKGRAKIYYPAGGV